MCISFGIKCQNVHAESRKSFSSMVILKGMVHPEFPLGEMRPNSSADGSDPGEFWPPCRGRNTPNLLERSHYEPASPGSDTGAHNRTPASSVVHLSTNRNSRAAGKRSGPRTHFRTELPQISGERSCGPPFLSLLKLRISDLSLRSTVEEEHEVRRPGPIRNQPCGRKSSLCCFNFFHWSSLISLVAKNKIHSISWIRN